MVMSEAFSKLNTALVRSNMPFVALNNSGLLENTSSVSIIPSVADYSDKIT